MPPSCAPLLIVAAGALRECCGAFASAAAEAEDGGCGGESPALEDAAVAFLRSVAVVLSAQLPRLEQQQQQQSSAAVPQLLESLLAATASLAEPRSFLAAAGAWRAVLARLAAAREAAEEEGYGGDEGGASSSSWHALSTQYEGGLALLAELVISRCFYCRGGGEGGRGGEGLFLAELDPSPGSGLGLEDGAVEAELAAETRDQLGGGGGGREGGGCGGSAGVNGGGDDDDWFGLSHLTDEGVGAGAGAGHEDDSERDVFRAGCTALLGRAADACPDAVLSRVLPAFHSALANYSRAATAAPGHQHHQALEATEDMATALEVLARCAGGMSAGPGSSEAAAAALAAVTSLLDAAPGLVQAGYTMSRPAVTIGGAGGEEDGDGTSLVVSAAARIAPAVYVAIGACAPWAARWLAVGGGGQGQGRAFLSAVLRAVLPPLTQVHDGSGEGIIGGVGGDPRVLGPAAGALAAVLGVARPSPADLIALTEMGEVLTVVPAMVLSGKLPAGGGGGDCLAALGAALLRRVPSEAADDAAAQMWEPRVGAFRALARTVVGAAGRGLEHLCSGGNGSDTAAAAAAAAVGLTAAAALVRSAGDAPAAPKRAAMSATVGALLPAVAAFLERHVHAHSHALVASTSTSTSAAVVAGSIAFLAAAVASAGPADIDSDALRRAASALFALADHGAVGAGGVGASRLLPFIALLLTRPGTHLAPLLPPVLSLTLGRWAVAAGRDGGVAALTPVGDSASSSHLAAELHAPLAAIHLAALRSRWSTLFPKPGTPAATAAVALASRDPAAAATLAAAPRAILEHAGGVLSGGVSADPGALRAVLGEMQRCRRQVNLLRAAVFVPLRPHFVAATLSAVVVWNRTPLG